jgi:NADH:ubiquinone oxidoreductase subunit E
MEESMLEELKIIHHNYLENEGNVITILQDIQNKFGYVPEQAVDWFSGKTGLAASKFYGVATFYSQFHLKQRGQNIITTCTGTVCHVKGSDRILFRMRDELRLGKGQETTRDGLFTLDEVACVGACSMAPVVLVNNEVNGMTNPGKMVKKIKKIRDMKK